MSGSKVLTNHAPRGSQDPAGDYERLGLNLAKRIKKTLKPKKGQAILDIGCGSGRVVLGLHKVLKSFRYLGYDIRLADILHAKSNVTSNNVDSQFVHFDFYNERYNQKGRIKDIKHYHFPSASKTFDHALATSFFTHTNTEMTRRCLTELKRVLKPGGTAYLTFFILGKNNAKSGRSNRKYVLEFESGVWAGDPTHILQSVAYEQKVLLQLLKDAELTVKHFIQGEWRGDAQDSFDPKLKKTGKFKIASSQDILIVKA
jgi:ubiquinone/menaquinone biosynthesis C-methylase UbiE